jgi:hypothetical protein
MLGLDTRLEVIHLKGMARRIGLEMDRGIGRSRGMDRSRGIDIERYLVLLKRMQRMVRNSMMTSLEIMN